MSDEYDHGYPRPVPFSPVNPWRDEGEGDAIA